mmetsp:Transcript_34876/g.90356  ORF Transcript_34876/g.90356 Transcript_34876/m.90356 type:complete len:289 (+) Transcript_34876:135-1001(+)
MLYSVSAETDFGFIASSRSCPVCIPLVLYITLVCVLACRLSLMFFSSLSLSLDCAFCPNSASILCSSYSCLFLSSLLFFSLAHDIMWRERRRRITPHSFLFSFDHKCCSRTAAFFKLSMYPRMADAFSFSFFSKLCKRCSSRCILSSILRWSNMRLCRSSLKKSSVKRHSSQNRSNMPRNHSLTLLSSSPLSRQCDPTCRMSSTKMVSTTSCSLLRRAKACFESISPHFPIESLPSKNSKPSVTLPPFPPSSCCAALAFACILARRGCFAVFIIVSNTPVKKRASARE